MLLCLNPSESLQAGRATSLLAWKSWPRIGSWHSLQSHAEKSSSTNDASVAGAPSDIVSRSACDSEARQESCLARVTVA